MSLAEVIPTMGVADRLAADVGGVMEDSEARAQLGELSHRLLSAS